MLRRCPALASTLEEERHQQERVARAWTQYVESLIQLELNENLLLTITLKGGKNTTER